MPLPIVTKSYQIRCWYCQKPVTNLVPAGVVFRAVAICPECLADSDETDNFKINEDQHADKQ